MKVEKALVVDDSKVAHLTLRKLLTERNIAVDWVGSGEDSIVYLKKQRPDVVFMDIMMPGMDGFETIQAIGKDSTLHLPPVIMCSANATDEEKRNAKNSGAIDFLTKPYTSEELDTVLDRLRRASAAAPSASSRASDHHAAPSAPTRSTETRAPAAGGTSSENVIHLAEQAAFSTADKVAREVAAEVARMTAEETARAIGESFERKATQVAAKAAQSITERIAQATAKDTAQGVAEEIARKVSAQSFDNAASNLKEHPAIGELRDHILQTLSGQISQQVQEALARALSGDNIKLQLQQVVKDTALPTVELTARAAATKIADERLAHQAEQRPHRGGGGFATLLALIALILAGAVAAQMFFGIDVAHLIRGATGK